MKSFPTNKFGYSTHEILNNQNRWNLKMVMDIIGNDKKHYVSTTYANRNDYNGLLEVVKILGHNNLCPKIIEYYPEYNTAVCEYMGIFMCDYMLSHPSNVDGVVYSVFNYFRHLNSMNQKMKPFSMPLIIRETILKSENEYKNDKFTIKAKKMLLVLEKSGIEFSYGYGIKDPHIWNFRILRNQNKVLALTTDFDFFSDRINYFWELGYFYATFRWLKKNSYKIVDSAERLLLNFIRNQGLKAEFMFWLGILSSYCGYRDSIINFIKNGKISILQEQNKIIRQVEKEISSLTFKLLENKKKSHYINNMDSYNEKVPLTSLERIRDIV